uniref:Beta-1,4-glucuronyltransferase 1 n=1 Tax=Strongyloides venezuelensis TaxID=75913 RepID=A0A0K0FIU5_STRVS
MCYQNISFGIMNDVFTLHMGVKKWLKRFEKQKVKSTKLIFHYLKKEFNRNLTIYYSHMKGIVREKKKMRLYILIQFLIVTSINCLLNLYKTPKVKVRVTETLEHNGRYCAAYYYWRDSMNLAKDSTRITLVLHATTEYIKYLAEQIVIWEGPMSVAFFVPTPQETECIFNKHKLCSKYDKLDILHFQILEYFRYLFDTSKISLHFFFNKGNFKKCPHVILKGIKKPSGDVMGKFAKALSLIKLSPKYFLNYPINTARNIARIGKRTRLFLSGDIENYSSSNYESKVSKLAEKVILNNNQTNLVLVHRRFEIRENAPVPKLKSELYELYKKKKAFVFHWFFYRIGHNIPRLKNWFKTEEDLNQTSISFTMLNKRYSWEPQFVGDDRVPFHDERFPYRIRSNSHLAHIMCFQNFSFAIMNNVFTVHKGIKMSLNVEEKKEKKNSWKDFFHLRIEFNRNLTRYYPHMKGQCKKMG